MKKLFLLTAVLLGAATVSRAGVSFSFGVGLPLAPAVCAPRVIYHAPAPVYTYAPAASAYCAPAAVYAAPAPVYYPPVVVAPPRAVWAPAPSIYLGFGGPLWYGHYHYGYHYGRGYRGWRR